VYIEKLYFVAEDCTALVSTTEQPAGTTTKNIETTTEAPTSKEGTTKAPETTTTGNETTTEAPTTKVGTIEPPETTTKSNETTTKAPTTKVGTTEPPETTTKMATTTMAPKPESPDINIYTARNSTSDAACLMIKAGIEFVIPYVAKAGVSR
jgi:hypothetical protein